MSLFLCFIFPSFVPCLSKNAEANVDCKTLRIFAYSSMLHNLWHLSGYSCCKTPCLSVLQTCYSNLHIHDFKQLRLLKMVNRAVLFSSSVSQNYFRDSFVAHHKKALVVISDKLEETIKSFPQIFQRSRDKGLFSVSTVSSS